MSGVFDRASLKCQQIVSFFKHTATPIQLSLDTLSLNPFTFVAMTSDGAKLMLKPRSGESFTFYENLVRHDYLMGGIVLSPRATVVDVGANIGSFTILAARIVGPSGRVVCFEPEPTVFERLRENVALNDLGNVTCIPAAVDGENGSLQLMVSKKSALSTAHNLEQTVPWTSIVEAPKVTLDRAMQEYNIGKIDLLKVDCEGCEYEIFEKMSPETAAKIAQISMEVHPVRGRTESSLLNRMTELGFDVRPRPFCWVATRRPRSA